MQAGRRKPVASFGNWPGDVRYASCAFGQRRIVDLVQNWRRPAFSSRRSSGDGFARALFVA
jgi:hypothetical protein